PVEAAEAAGLVHFAFRHRVDELITEDGAVVGVRGRVLAASHTGRGVASNREEVADFELRAPAVIVTSGGVGDDVELMVKAWPTGRLGRLPERVLAGVPAHGGGRVLQMSGGAGANLTNRARVWAYAEGIENWNPIWPEHGIRIIPGAASMW